MCSNMFKHDFCIFLSVGTFPRFFPILQAFSRPGESGPPWFRYSNDNENDLNLCVIECISSGFPGVFVFWLFLNTDIDREGQYMSGRKEATYGSIYSDPS